MADLPTIAAVGILIVAVGVFLFWRSSKTGVATSALAASPSAPPRSAAATGSGVLWSAASESGHFRVAARQFDTDVVLDCSGLILLGEGELVLRDAANRLAQQGCLNVALNLAGVPSIDSAGIGEIVRTHTLFSRRGGHLVLMAPTESVRDLLAITRLAEVLEVARTEADVAALFRRAAGRIPGSG